MGKDTAGSDSSSTTTWDTLEGMVRQKAQEFIQTILSEKGRDLRMMADLVVHQAGNRPSHGAAAAFPPRRSSEQPISMP
jgi:hypothetical protein